MYRVNQITTDPWQTQTLTLPDGTVVTLELYYRPMQYGWFASITYGTFVLDGIRVSCSPNILRQWKNIIPFGLACTTILNREPTQQQDFSSNAFQVYVLSKDDVEAYEAYLKTGAPN